MEDGVIRLLEGTDDFYEGVYHNQTKYVPRSERPWHIWPLWLVQNGYLWAIRRHIPQGSSVVELGCAGGVRYLGQRYHMMGCDLSFGSLKELSSYERRVQADASKCIPLMDASVDAVVSSYFWEHIPPAVKPSILKECRRILRPRGKVIFLYDVETDNPLISHYKKQNIALYNKLFIEGDGHYGYERPGKNISTFEAEGFRILEHRGLEKTFIQSLSAYSKLEQFGGPGRIVFRMSKRLGNSRWYYPYTALVRIVDELADPILSEQWARMDLVVAQK